MAEETLTAIKVVASFGREDRELEKFKKNADETRAVAKKATFNMSLMVGIMKFTIFFFYTFAMFWGSRYIYRFGYTQREVLIVLIALITGFVQLISSLPNIQAIMALKVMGKIIFNVIERKPKIRNASDYFKGQALKLD